MPIGGGVIPGFDFDSDVLIDIPQQTFTAQTIFPDPAAGGAAYVGNWDSIEVRVKANGVDQGVGRGILLVIEWADDPSFFTPGSQSPITATRVTSRRMHFPARHNGAAIPIIARVKLKNRARWVRVVAVVQSVGNPHMLEGAIWGTSRPSDLEWYPPDSLIFAATGAGGATSSSTNNELTPGKYRLKARSLGGPGSFTVQQTSFDSSTHVIMASNTVSNQDWPESANATPGGIPGWSEFYLHMAPYIISWAPVAPTTSSDFEVIWTPV